MKHHFVLSSAQLLRRHLHDDFGMGGDRSSRSSSRRGRGRGTNSTGATDSLRGMDLQKAARRAPGSARSRSNAAAPSAVSCKTYFPPKGQIIFASNSSSAVVAARRRRHVKLLVQGVQQTKIAQRSLPRSGVAEIVDDRRDAGVRQIAHLQPHLRRPGGLLKAKLRHHGFEHLALEGEDRECAQDRSPASLVLPPPAAETRRRSRRGRTAESRN